MFEVITSFLSIIATVIAAVVTISAYLLFQKKIREKEETTRNQAVAPGGTPPVPGP